MTLQCTFTVNFTGYQLGSLAVETHAKEHSWMIFKYKNNIESGLFLHLNNKAVIGISFLYYYIMVYSLYYTHTWKKTHFVS